MGTWVATKPTRQLAAASFEPPPPLIKVYNGFTTVQVSLEEAQALLTQLATAVSLAQQWDLKQKGE